MHNPSRRRAVVRLAIGGLALAPLAAAISALSRTPWPEGMAEIQWGRDTCARCRMAISNRRFAVEVRGGPGDEVFKFDDIGCAIYWLRNREWAGTARIWVADAGSGSENPPWLDGRAARYQGGQKSPMGYNFAAGPQPQDGSLSFEEMARQVLLKGR